MSRHGMSTEQASKVKLKGHQREKEFNNKYGSSDDELNYSGASADCEIRQGHKILETLQKVIGTNSREVSLKGGNTMQIHLGNLPELTDKNNYTVSKKIVKNKKATCVDHGIPFSQQVKNLQQKAFWNKYLKKGDILAYSYDNGSHIFFNMDDVNDFIIKECEWRHLETGRLKGDIQGKQYLTYEYRAKKDSFVLGAHGGKKGKEFIDLLVKNLRHKIV